MSNPQHLSSACLGCHYCQGAGSHSVVMEYSTNHDHLGQEASLYAHPQGERALPAHTLATAFAGPVSPIESVAAPVHNHAGYSASASLLGSSATTGQQSFQVPGTTSTTQGSASAMNHPFDSVPSPLDSNPAGAVQAVRKSAQTAETKSREKLNAAYHGVEIFLRSVNRSKGKKADNLREMVSYAEWITAENLRLNQEIAAQAHRPGDSFQQNVHFNRSGAHAQQIVYNNFEYTGSSSSSPT